MPQHRLPFEFPGNRERLGNRWIPDETALAGLLTGNKRVFIVGTEGTLGRLRALEGGVSLKLLTRVGEWELISNR